MNLNQWIGEGPLSCDPLIRYTGDKRAVTNFTLYVNNSFKSKTDDGSFIIKKRHNRIPVVAWAGKAEVISKNYKKGDKVRLVGSIRTRLVERDGVKINSFEIVADNISMIREASYED